MGQLSPHWFLVELYYITAIMNQDITVPISDSDDEVDWSLWYNHLAQLKAYFEPVHLNQHERSDLLDLLLSEILLLSAGI